MRNKFIEFAKEQKDDGFCTYEWSDRVVVRGSQVFAVFGNIAYDVTKMKFGESASGEPAPGTGKLCVAIKGRYLAQFPDEGKSGIMGMYIVHYRGQNRTAGPTFVVCGWLHTEELGLTNAEITGNILDDMAEGKNVYWPKPAGWV